MNRKEFLKKGLTALGVSTVLPYLRAMPEKEKPQTHKLGYNHLPNQEIQTMNTVLHKADTRGHANHGWLDTYHTFSFANYHNPDRMHFGVLRVLNDDTVAGGRGFGKHPHDNMEIITIPLEGDLKHEDSMGNSAIIKEGDVQVMSAGTGVYHSEYNANKEQEVKLLQIWLFPSKRNVTPRYDQISLEDIVKENEFYQVLSPNPEDQGVWIHQNAWFQMGNFDKGVTETYEIQSEGNGAYIFVIDGTIEVEGQELNKRDGFGIWNTRKIRLTSASDSRVLLMDVPMEL